MRPVWSEAARADARAVFEYVADHNEAAATRLLDMIVDAAERVPVHPYMFRAGRMAGTREAIVHPNYILIYRVGTDMVEIVALIHARQQYP